MRLIALTDLQQFAAVNLSDDPGAIGGKLKIPFCVQITLRFQLFSGKVGHVVTYGKYVGPFSGNATTAQTIFANLSTGANWTAMASKLSNSVSFLGVDIRDLNVTDQPLFSSTGAAVPGTDAAGIQLPSEVCIACTTHTALAGKSGRGRMYFAGFTSSSQGAGDTVSAATITAINNWANTFFSVFNGVGYQWSLGLKERAAYTSPKTGTSFPHRDATTVPITTVACRDNHWDTQRRRGLR